MSTYNYKPGLGHAAAYQVSGIPFVQGPLVNAGSSGGPFKIEFPAVTRFVTIINADGSNEVQIGFSSNGVKNETNAFPVPKESAVTVDVKVTELYYTGSSSAFSVVAGLTFFNPDQLDNTALSPSGSNWSGSLNAFVG